MNKTLLYSIFGTLLFIAFTFVYRRKKDPVKNENSGQSVGRIEPELRYFKNSNSNIHKDAQEEGNIKYALSEVKKKYGVDVARNVERIYRLETRNFESLQYLLTYSAGMEVHKETYPYGWTTPSRVWGVPNSERPEGYIQMKENGTFLNKRFIRFPNLRIAMLSLGAYVSKYGANRWYSTIPEKQREYAQKLSRQKVKFV